MESKWHRSRSAGEEALQVDLWAPDRQAAAVDEDLRALREIVFELADRGTLFLDEIGELPPRRRPNSSTSCRRRNSTASAARRRSGSTSA